MADFATQTQQIPSPIEAGAKQDYSGNRKRLSAISAEFDKNKRLSPESQKFLKGQCAYFSNLYTSSWDEIRGKADYWLALARVLEKVWPGQKNGKDMAGRVEQAKKHPEKKYELTVEAWRETKKKQQEFYPLYYNYAGADGKQLTKAGAWTSIWNDMETWRTLVENLKNAGCDKAAKEIGGALDNVEAWKKQRDEILGGK